MRFRLGNIPVEVRWSFFLVAVLLAFDRIGDPLSLATWCMVAFASVLFHELGHAFAFIRFGHSPSIELYQMGGVTRGSPGVPTSPGRHVLISLAGPLAGFLLGSVVLLVSRKVELPPTAARIASDLIWVNIGWGLFNLVPIWPLDGGQAFVGILRLVSPRRGELVGMTISCIATIALVILALSAGQRYMAFIAGWFGWSGFVRLRWIWSRGADGIQEEKLAEILPLVQAGRTTEAIAIASELIATGNDMVKRDARHLLACCYLEMSDPKQALAALDGDTSNRQLLGVILSRIQGREQEAAELLNEAHAAEPDGALGLVAEKLNAGDLDGARQLVEAHPSSDQACAMVEVALFRAARFEQALAISELRFRKFGVANAAYNAACSLARLGRSEEAIEFLRRSLSAGMPDRKQMATDEDLASLRGHPAFEALLVHPSTE